MEPGRLVELTRARANPREPLVASLVFPSAVVAVPAVLGSSYGEAPLPVRAASSRVRSASPVIQPLLVSRDPHAQPSIVRLGCPTWGSPARPGRSTPTREGRDAAVAYVEAEGMSHIRRKLR